MKSSNAKGAILDDSKGIGTITNDDRARRNSNWLTFSTELEDILDELFNRGRKTRR